MADEKKLPTDAAENEEESDREDLSDMLGLMSEASAQLKWSGLLLGLGILLGGLFLSREFGRGFLIGGAILAVLIGGGLAIGSALAPGAIKKQADKQDRRMNKTSK